MAVDHIPRREVIVMIEATQFVLALAILVLVVYITKNNRPSGKK